MRFLTTTSPPRTRISILLPLYFLLLSLIDAFNFSGTITIGIILSTLMAIVLGTRQLRRLRPTPAVGLAFCLCAAFIAVALVSLVHQAFRGRLGPHAVPHLISYAAVFILFWGAVEWYIELRQEPLFRIFRMITYGALAAATFVVVEFVAKNFLGIALDNLLPRVSTDHYDALYFIGTWGVFRARGFASESGHMALYLLIFLPFVYYYFAHYSSSRLKAIFGVTEICVAIACTTSAAALADIVVVSALVFGIYVFSTRRRRTLRFGRSKVIAISLVGFFVAAVIVVQVTTGSILVSLQGVVNKLSFSNHSTGSRFDRWHSALKMFENNPVLGGGPGAAVTANGTGSANLYLDILADTGIIGLAIFLIILAVVLSRIISLSTPIRWVYLCSFFVGAIHSVAISNYWYPWMWLIFALVNYSYTIERDRGSRARQLPVASPTLAGDGATSTKAVPEISELL